MAYPGLLRVDCKYGAPMGRGNRIGEPPDEEEGTKLYLRRLDFVDGCYDEGGAYWGAPADLYHAVNEDRTVEVFVRADSRDEAKDAVRDMIPWDGVEFFR